MTLCRSSATPMLIRKRKFEENLRALSSVLQYRYRCRWTETFAQNRRRGLLQGRRRQCFLHFSWSLAQYD
jgi:hypothetical protein